MNCNFEQGEASFGTEIYVHNLFFDLPLRRTVQESKTYQQVCASVRSLVVSASLLNPGTKLELRSEKTNSLLYSTPKISDGLCITLLSEAWGNHEYMDWCKIRGGIVQVGFIARKGAPSNALRLLGRRGLIERSCEWIHEVLQAEWARWWSKSNHKLNSSWRFPAYVILLMDDIANLKRINHEKDVKNLVRKGFGNVYEPHWVSDVPTKPMRRREIEERFQEWDVRKRSRQASVWEGNHLIRKQLMRPMSEGSKFTIRTPATLDRLTVMSPSVQKAGVIERTFRMHIRGWTNPTFAGVAKMKQSLTFYRKAQVMVRKDHINMLQVLGQVDKKFILVARADVIYAVDQHAASERYLFERMLRGVKESVESRELICAKRTALDDGLCTVGKLNKQMLENWGWRFEFEGLCVRITAVPYFKMCGIIADSCIQFVKLLGQLRAGEVRGVPKGIQELISSKACHAAVRFGDILTKSQCESIIQSLHECDSPFTCAHGRPSIVPLIVLGGNSI